MAARYLGGRVVVTTGDITSLAVDAIVNAANSALMGGGGVDGAIHDRGGSSVTAACGELRRTRYPDGLPVGEAVLTTAGNLPARERARAAFVQTRFQKSVFPKAVFFNMALTRFDAGIYAYNF